MNDFGWFAVRELNDVGMKAESLLLTGWLLDIFNKKSTFRGAFPALLVPVSLDQGYPCAIGSLQNEPTLEPGPSQITFLTHGKGCIRLFVHKFTRGSQLCEHAFLSGHVWCQENPKPNTTPSPSNPVSLYTRYGRKTDYVLQKLVRKSRALLKHRRLIQKNPKKKKGKQAKHPTKRVQLRQRLAAASRARVPVLWPDEAKVASVKHRPLTRSRLH